MRSFPRFRGFLLASQTGFSKLTPAHAGEEASSEDLVSSPSTAQDMSERRLEGVVTGEAMSAPSAKIHPPVHAEGLPAEVPGLEYLGAPLPANEEERYEVLCGLETLDTVTQPDERFDDITKLVSQT